MSDSQKYGVPLYGGAWVPPSVIITSKETSEPKSPAKEDTASESKSPQSSENRHVILAGGGGEGNSGIRNAFLVSSFDFISNSLSDQPLSRHGTGSDLAYRIAVHPGGEGVLASFPNACRLFEWVTDEHPLRLTSSERVLEQLQDVGQQLAMTFNNDGDLLALGCENGKLRLFKWPDMEPTLNEASGHSAVKDLDFSPDGKFLVSVGSGPGRIWNLSTSTSVASLPKQNGENFGSCRFSRTMDTDQVLYTTSNRDNGGSIVKWNTTSWQRISSKHISRHSISSFNVSPDGKLLAAGTVEGDIVIIRSANMRVHTFAKKAHLGIVTAVSFSPDSRALLSASLDSSVRVTLIKDKKNEGVSMWIILLIILLAVAVYYAKSQDLFSLKL